MNDNLYQSKAGVFTPGWFLWPAITIPSSRQIRIMMMHCNCRMEPCTSLQWRFSSMPQHWCPATLRYVRQVTLFIFSFSSKHLATKSQGCSQTSIVYRNGLAAWMVKYPRNKSATVLATLSHFSIHTPAAGGQSWCWWGRALFWSSVPRDSRGRHKHLFRASLHLFHF